MPGGELDAGHPGQPGGQQFVGDGRHARARALHLQQPGEVLGGVPDVQAGEVAPAFVRLGRFVVEPDGGAEAAGGLGGEREGVAGGVAEAGRHLPVARVQAVLGEQVGVDDLGGAAGVVRQGAARHGLDVAEVRAAQTEAEGGAGAVAVGGLQDDQATAGADQGGAGAQEFVQGGIEGAGAGEALGEFVEGREIGDPPGQPVLQQGAGGGAVRRGDRGNGGGGCGSVCGCGNRGIDSSHFRRVRGVHGVRPSDRCVLLKSIANPHVILRR